MLNIRRADPEVLIVWTHGDEHALTAVKSLSSSPMSSITAAWPSPSGHPSRWPKEHRKALYHIALLLPESRRCPGLRQEARGYGRPPETFTVLTDSAMMLAEAIRRAAPPIGPRFWRSSRTSRAGRAFPASSIPSMKRAKRSMSFSSAELKTSSQSSSKR